MTLMERRRGMMGAAKGEEEGMFQKLETITLTKSGNTVDFDLTQYPDIHFFVIRMNTNLSASDWVYLRINDNRVKAYTAKYAQYTDTEIAVCRTGAAPAWHVGMTSLSFNYMSSARPNKVGFEPYSGSTNFSAGSTFELFGAKLP